MPIAKTDYVSHMRAVCYDAQGNIITMFDGQFVGMRGSSLMVDGQEVAYFSPIRQNWYIVGVETRVSVVQFIYVDESQRVLPNN